MSQKLAFAMDIGGTRTKYGLIDLERRALLAYRVEATQAVGMQSFLQTTNVVLDLLCRQAQVERKQITMGGIGIPGYVDGDTISMVWPSLAFLEGDGCRAELETTLGIALRQDNDARVAALGEAHFGKHGLARRLLSLTLGTGLGFGMVIDGELLEKHSLNHMAGHILLRPGARTCFCGFSGCLESLISASGLEDFFSAYSQSEEGKKVDAQAIFTQADEGHLQANQVLKQFVADLTTGLNTYIYLYAPDIIVLGGGMSRQLVSRLPVLQQGLFAQPYQRYMTRVAVSHLQEYAGLYGAASLWLAV